MPIGARLGIIGGVVPPYEMRGRLRWSATDEGEPAAPFAADRYAAVARAEAGAPADDWSIVIEGIEPLVSECDVTAHWLVEANVDFRVAAGARLIVSEGSRQVAILAVSEVLDRS